MEPILVTGGTGTLGRLVVQRLIGAGHAVRVLSRRPHAEDAPHSWATGNLEDGTGIADAVSDVDTIVHCATTLGAKDVAATRNLVEAARRAGNPHLVYISIVGIDRLPFFYYRAKLDSERIIEESGLPWTILRTTQFHELLVKIFAIQRWLPVTLTLSGTDFQPVDAGEVADRLAELAVAEPAGRVPDMGGPEIRGARELARAHSRAAGRRRPVLPVRVPGAFFAAYRAGHHTTPEHADGKITFDEFLATHVAAKGV
ncbi:SDR family oxidoreductase [Amycolatopsis anabasis]|uniref:SDR family oxidoreductase n=1 Tax=Amycolatopsis anabasis TaxID=1840409 RepID=UPI00131CAB9F|nr:NAD(P)H-binding protein [Amycolatopsis anabasis]